MGNTPDYAISGMEIAFNGRKLQQHRPASIAADGKLEIGESRSTAD
jgi:hypothetical protein